MFYSVKGKLIEAGRGFVVLEDGGVGYEIKVSALALSSLSEARGELVRLFTRLEVKDDRMELFGFLTPEERGFFELLTSVSGVGSKTALGILGLAPLPSLASAIAQGNVGFLTKAAGIGKKTAERLIVELRDKLGSHGLTALEGSDEDVFDALVSLGYTRAQARSALFGLDESLTSVEGRVKAALKSLKGAEGRR